MAKYLVIIPTYNEIENIEKIVPEILKIKDDLSILVVDDNSPDKTGELVKKMSQSDSRLHLLSRQGKQGLGKAYIAGMKWALDKDYDYITQMDADFSHRVEDLSKLIAQSKNYDLVVGSRWVPGGSVVNWSLLRKFISRFGSFYASLILRKDLKDWTGGFNLWKASKLKSLDLNSINSNGYSFQIEMKYTAICQSFKYTEQAITFVDRRVGQSKMSKKIIIEALFRVWSFRSKKF